MNRIICAATAFFIGTAALADQATELTVNDPAPALEISHWLKGEEIARFQPGKIYVVEFWATWCGPCKASMPHITELQHRYKEYDVTFIGISDENLQTVVDFLLKDEWNEKTQYTLATDPDRSTYLSFMLASGNTGIPTAFIIGRDGKVEWIGHPMTIDEPLEAVVKDAWDRMAFREGWEATMADKRVALQPRIRFERARAQKDWNTAIALLDEWIAEKPEQKSAYQMAKFEMMLGAMNEPATGYALGEEIVKSTWDDAQSLNRIAWYVLDNAAVKSRNFEFAHKAASRAAELTDHKDAAILDTLARACFESGDIEAAIKWQRAAVKNAPDGPMAEEIEKTLERYEKAAGSR